MDLGMIKTQLADFGTFVSAMVDIAKNLMPSLDNLGDLLDFDKMGAFFDGTSSAYEGLSSTKDATEAAATK